MNKKVSNVIFSIFMLLLIVGIIIGVVWLVKNWETLSTQTDLYSYEDLVEYGDEKYQEGLEASDNYKILYEETLKSLNQAEDRVNDLTADHEDAINSGNVDKEIIAGLQQDLAEAQADLIAKQEQIEELNNTITFYEKLLEAYENSDKLIITFMLVDNGKEIPYDVQAVEPSAYLSAVMTPEKDDFEGWSLTKGGELINDLTTIQVTENMTIYGMCTNTVTFMVNGEEYTTQEVSYGECAQNVVIENTTYELYNGWRINDELVLIETYNIYSDTIFNADITYKYDVKFIVDNEEYNTQIVIENGFAELPAEPVKEGYDFKGWSIDKLNIVNVPEIKITTNTNFTAMFTINFTGSYKLSYKFNDYEFTEFSENCYFNINDDGKNITVELVSSERKDSSSYSSDIVLDLTNNFDTVVYHIYYNGPEWMATSILMDTTVYIKFDREQETYYLNSEDEYHLTVVSYLEKI